MSKDSATPTPYAGLNKMPLAGEWRDGRAGKSLTDMNPYTGESLLELALADEATGETHRMRVGTAGAADGAPAYAFVSHVRRERGPVPEKGLEPSRPAGTGT